MTVLSDSVSSSASDPVEEIGLALGEVTVAADLGQAFDAVARHLAVAVGAHTALVAATGVEANGADALMSVPAGGNPALVLALQPGSADPGDVVIRFVSGQAIALPDGGRWCGMSARFHKGARTGVVLAVIPTRGDGSESAAHARTINAFAELAQLCVVRAEDGGRPA